MLAELTKLKDQGNQHFKKNEIAEALSSFSEALKKVETCQQSMNPDSSGELNKLTVILLINSALAHLNLKTKDSYLSAERCCDSALKIDPTNVKALYRRGLALKQYGNLVENESGVGFAGLIGYYKKAKADFEAVHLQEKDNKIAKDKFTETIKDIYRVRKTLGHDGQSETLAEHSMGSPLKEDPHRAEVMKKRQMNMEKILEAYKVPEVTQMVRSKVEKAYLQEPLPSTRSELEKALRELEKNPDGLLKFSYRFTKQYLETVIPTFDIMMPIVALLVSSGEGEPAKQALRAIRHQKCFTLLWKSMISREKNELKAKWTTLGLDVAELP